jgi:hypothetical protein
VSFNAKRHLLSYFGILLSNADAIFANGERVKEGIYMTDILEINIGNMCMR